MSSAPISRSSLAPTGSSTSRAGRVNVPAPLSCGPSGQDGSGSAGSQENRHPATTATSGRIAASARTMVDFAVPFSPRASTPPIAGDTALSTSPSRSSSMPTTALKGNPLTGPPLVAAVVCGRCDNAYILLWALPQRPQKNTAIGGARRTLSRLFAFQVALQFQVHRPQRLQGAVVRLGPQAAVGGLEQPFGY